MKILFWFIICISGLVLMTYIIEPSQPSRENAIRGEVVGKATNFLKEKYGFVLCGAGGGTNDEGIWLIASSFYYQHDPISEQQARKLTVNCVDDFLSIINASEDLRPYLRDVPFTAKNLSIIIILTDLDGKRVHYPYIETISAAENELTYSTRDPNQRYGYKTEVIETYEQAVEILKKESLSYDNKDI
jgi:hypothetical protein